MLSYIHISNKIRTACFVRTEHSLNRQINQKILSVISSSGLVEIQKDFTRNDKILDLLAMHE